jgi:hypothetical protein
VDWNSVEQFVASGEAVKESNGLPDMQATSQVSPHDEGGIRMSHENLPTDVETAPKEEDGQMSNGGPPKTSVVIVGDKRGSQSGEDPEADAAGPDPQHTFKSSKQAMEENIKSAHASVKTVRDERVNIQTSLTAATNQNNRYIGSMKALSGDYMLIGNTTQALEDTALEEVNAFESHRGLAVRQASELVKRWLPGASSESITVPPLQLSKEEYDKIQKMKTDPDGCMTGTKAGIERECKEKPADDSTSPIDQAINKVLTKVCGEEKDTYIGKAAAWCLDDKVKEPFEHAGGCTLECDDAGAGSKFAGMYIMALEDTKEEISTSACASDPELKKIFDGTSECCNGGLCDSPKCDTRMYVLYQACIDRKAQQAGKDFQDMTNKPNEDGTPQSPSDAQEDAEEGTGTADELGENVVRLSSFLDAQGTRDLKGQQLLQAAEIKLHHEVQDPSQASKRMAFLGGKNA